MATTTGQLFDARRGPPYASEGVSTSRRYSMGQDGSLNAGENPLSHLETMWNRADRAIRAASRALRHLAQPESAALGGVEQLLDPSGLLHKALREAHNALGPARKLVQAEAAGSQPVPRAYVLAKRFLREIDYDVDKNRLLTFLAAFEDELPLQLPELWLFKSLMELALLECIGDIAAAWDLNRHSPMNAPGDSRSESEVGLATLVSSLQRVMDCDWEEVLGEVSVTETILREDPSGDYSWLDLETRQTYRNVVADMAAHSRRGEQEIARLAVRLAREPEILPSRRARERREHVGYYLVDKGDQILKRAIGYRAPPAKRVREIVLRWPSLFYFSGIGFAALAVLALFTAVSGARSVGIIEFILFLLPAVECGVATMNLAATLLIPPRKLPKLDFSKGIPGDRTTLVAVPTLLTSEAQVKRVVRDIEIRYLANCDPNLHFALLTDPPDSLEAFDEKDALAELCSDLIRKLNEKYAHRQKGSFLHLHRDRVYQQSDGIWMGWERKRGKLLDLNNLLLNHGDSFPIKAGDLSVLPRIKYVITLDQDTQLPKDSARKLVGALAHPLNRAVVDPATNTVVEGYGILQPRVEISPKSASRSRLAEIFSGETGLDIYTRAVSDVYQDLFAEGIFTGKGIYEVETFQKVLANRFPCNTILSHDLIEGVHARTGLASDVEVVDDYPPHLGAYSRRKHRWIRGDWQITRWLFPRVPDRSGAAVRNPLSFVSRWKIADNLRRSLTDFATFTLLLCGWFLLPGKPLYWTLATLAVFCFPTFFHLVSSWLRAGNTRYSAVSCKNTAPAIRAASARLFLRLTLLCYQSLIALDAVVRTLIRMSITHRRLLQWETSAEAELSGHPRDSVETYLDWTPWLSLAVTFAMAVLRPSALVSAAPFLVLWGSSKTICGWLNEPRGSRAKKIGVEEKALLRNAALRTWRFFREFSNAEENWLIPDAVQETPPLVEHLVSPTNLGLLLDSRLAAYDLGFLTLPEFVSATERTFETLERMPTHNGHFYNWYDTLTLEPVEPRFVSTVDSGNLICCLWTLRQACLGFARQPLFRKELWDGVHDHLVMLDGILAGGQEEESVASSVRDLRSRVKSLAASNWTHLEALPGLAAEIMALEERCSTAEASGEIRWWVHELSLRVSNLQDTVYDFAPWIMPQFAESWRETGTRGRFRIEDLTVESLSTIRTALEERFSLMETSEGPSHKTRPETDALRSLLCRSESALRDITARLARLAAAADSLARKMDFGYLYDPDKKLLSIGYDAKEGRRCNNAYDLLASEARAAAFVAIAKGEIPQESWFHFGRPQTTLKSGRVLLSWTGTMFEYLLPSLWMRSDPNTLLEQTVRAAVRAQQEFAAEKSIPWGISESSCKETNPDGRYQYRAFGSPALALSRQHSDELVVAPYATFLGLLVDASGAMSNLERMREMGWLGAYGFYEACDFTAPRSGGDNGGELVRCWMAHHQGMSLVSVANALCNSSMQRRFHAEPMVAAVERLLQEKFPPPPALDAVMETREELPYPSPSVPRLAAD